MRSFVRTSWLALALCAILVGCRGERGDTGDIGPVGPSGSSTPDRQIRFELAQHYYGYTHADTSWFIVPLLYKFNTMNYPGVDSIVFMAVLHTESAGDTATVELHTVSEHTPVAGSRLATSSTSDTEMSSGNLYGAIPARDITLGIRIRSSEAGKRAYLTGATLLLYRK